MDLLPAAATTGSDSDPNSHVSVGAADGTVGSTDLSNSWDALPVPGSPATPPGGQVGAATAPGHSARATGSATDRPPPPQVMSPSLQRDLEASIQQLRKDVDDIKADDGLSQFAQNVVNQMTGIQDQIDRLTSKQPSTPETQQK